MSNTAPLDLAARLGQVARSNPFKSMTVRQYRQFERMRARHEHRILGTLKWTAPPTPHPRPTLSARHEQARARSWDRLWRCSLHHSVAAYCDPATCPRGHQRPRLHSIPRADLARNLSQAGRTMVGILGDR
jgi:hypothetical protein